MDSSTKLGPFWLRECIGMGGMAKVYRAELRASGQEVAIKVIRHDRASNFFREAFEREAHSVARLHHPGIVRLFDVGSVSPDDAATSDGVLFPEAPYLVMELVTGGTFAGEKVNTWPLLRGALYAVLDALAHAHAAGVIHRDLKPANVLTKLRAGAPPSPLLTDFGVARFFEVPEVAEGNVVGTPRYMAPEQIVGDVREQGPWTDLYSLGVLAWQVVTGVPPYEGHSTSVLAAHLQEEPPEFTPRFHVPPRLEEWLRTLLQTQPFDRFQGAAEASAALMDMSIGGPTVAGRAPLPPPAIDESQNPTLVVLHEYISSGHHRLPSPQPSVVGTSQWPIPPVPDRWQEPLVPAAPALSGVGLGLVGLRALPLIDRASARDTLWSAIREVSASQSPRQVALVGEAGSGKSELAEWFCRRCRELGVATTLKVSHSPMGSDSDGIRPALERLLKTRGLTRDEVFQRVQDYFDRVGYRGSVALRDAMTLANYLSRSSAAQVGSTAGERLERARAVDRLLASVSAVRPLVIWIDDAQWGPDAVRYAREFADGTLDSQCSSILTVLTVRQESVASSDELRRLFELDTTEAIDVERLADDDMMVLLAELAGLEPGLSRSVVQRAAGNPLFAIQLVADWVERGLLQPSENGFLLSEETHALPDTIHALWQARIARFVRRTLDPAATSLAIEVAAVLGRDVRREEWARALELLGAEVPTGLAERLSAAGLAAAERDFWSFAHGLLRESVCQSLRQSERWAELNSVCADALAGRSLGHEAEPWDRVGRHLLDADRPLEAFEAMFNALRIRFRSGDYPAALRTLAFAEQLADTMALDASHQVRGNLRIWQARHRRATGFHDEAVAQCEDLLHDARRWGWADLEVAALGELSAVNGQIKHQYEEGLRYGYEALRLLEGGPEDLTLVDALRRLSMLHALNGDLTLATSFGERALELCFAIDYQVGIATTLVALGNAHLSAGDLEKARPLFQRARDTAEKYFLTFEIGDALNGLGDVQRLSGEFGEASHSYEEARDIWLQLGAGSAAVAEINLWMTLTQAGLFQKALDQLETRPAVPVLARFYEAIRLACYAGTRNIEAYDAELARIEASGHAVPSHVDLAALARVTAAALLSAGHRARAERMMKSAYRQYVDLSNEQGIADVLGEFRAAGFPLPDP